MKKEPNMNSCKLCSSRSSRSVFVAPEPWNIATVEALTIAIASRIGPSSHGEEVNARPCDCDRDEVAKQVRDGFSSEGDWPFGGGGPDNFRGLNNLACKAAMDAFNEEVADLPDCITNAERDRLVALGSAVATGCYGLSNLAYNAKFAFGKPCN